MIYKTINEIGDFIIIADGANTKGMETLLEDLKKSTIPLLKSQQYYEKVGAFEGGCYFAKEPYRPKVDCIMFSCNLS